MATNERRQRRPPVADDERAEPPGSGVGFARAMRVRDVSRPGPEDLAEAARTVQIRPRPARVRPAPPPPPPPEADR